MQSCSHAAMQPCNQYTTTTPALLCQSPSQPSQASGTAVGGCAAHPSDSQLALRGGCRRSAAAWPQRLCSRRRACQNKAHTHSTHARTHNSTQASQTGVSAAWCMHSTRRRISQQQPPRLPPALQALSLSLTTEGRAWDRDGSAPNLAAPAGGWEKISRAMVPGASACPPSHSVHRPPAAPI
jgi:hypothetical protein